MKITKIKLTTINQSKMTIAALIGCISIYGITSSLLTPLLSIILESRKIPSSIIGGLAMIAPAGLIIGAFAVSRFMRNFGGRSLLFFGVTFEIVLIIALMNSSSIFTWFVIRFMGGLADSLLFVVTETWIMEITPKEKRGKIMGFYNSILMMSFALGPLIITFSGTKGILPFIICIFLLISAGIPLLWVDRYVPKSIEKPRFNVISFAFVAPLLALGCFVVAFQDLAITSLMPIYGLRLGMEESSATLMLFFGIAGGALLQFPIGWVADKIGAKKVLIFCSLAGLVGTIIWPLIVSMQFLLWTVLFLWWGFFAGVTTVTMILAGSWFKGSELATAMAALGVFWGLGAFVGPFVSGAIMDIWDPYGLPLTLVIISGSFFIITLIPNFYRVKRNKIFV